MFDLDRPASPLPSGTSAKRRDVWPAVTVNAAAQGDFGGLAALERNNIFELDDTKPDFFCRIQS